MIRPQDLIAKKGQKILPFWAKLIEYLASLKVVSSGGARVSVTPQGTYVSYDLVKPSWNHPFSVSIANNSATVSEGRVNISFVPTINTKTIDGLNEEGVFVAYPELPLKAKEDGKSYVALKVVVDAKGKIDPANKEAVSIVELDTLDPSSLDAGVTDAAGVGYQPLAVVYWKNNAVVRTFEIVHHNLQHRFIEGTLGKPARHLFFV